MHVFLNSFNCVFPSSLGQVLTAAPGRGRGAHGPVLFEVAAVSNANWPPCFSFAEKQSPADSKTKCVSPMLTKLCLDAGTNVSWASFRLVQES